MSILRIIPVAAMAWAAVALIAVAACLPSTGGPTPTSTPPASVPEGLEPVWEAWRTLQNEFVGKNDLSTEEVAEAAIRGILDALDDPYSSYLAPDEFILFSDFSGEFEGIGAEVTVRDDQIIIVAPLPDTPASRAGIRPGDVILAVDGDSIEGKSLLEVVLVIRGAKGTPVTLEVLHADATTTTEITIVRDTIDVSTVESRMLEPGIGYVQLSSFDEPTAQDLRDALNNLDDQGMQGLVLDLRNNPGGLLDTAVGVASQFIDDGLVLYSVGPDGERTEFEARSGGAATDIPMVVVVNGFSASASEVVTGALQDHGRALVVGSTTFGKGSVNILHPLSNQGGIYFTIARWFTPDGRLIEGEGLQPDVEVLGPEGGIEVRRLRVLAFPLCAAYDESQEELRGPAEFVDAVRQLCEVPSGADDGGDSDPQLDRAVSVLREQMERAR